jgi:hypothetical protein
MFQTHRCHIQWDVMTNWHAQESSSQYSDQRRSAILVCKPVTQLAKWRIMRIHFLMSSYQVSSQKNALEGVSVIKIVTFVIRKGTSFNPQCRQRYIILFPTALTRSKYCITCKWPTFIQAGGQNNGKSTAGDGETESFLHFATRHARVNWIHFL